MHERRVKLYPLRRGSSPPSTPPSSCGPLRTGPLSGRPGMSLCLHRSRSGFFVGVAFMLILGTKERTGGEDLEQIHQVHEVSQPIRSLCSHPGWSFALLPLLT